jgi:hypothetical protein
MANRQQRGNREAKKPKKEKIKVIAAAPSQRPQHGSRPWLPAKRNSERHLCREGRLVASAPAAIPYGCTR